jgi:hypothetical protein
LIDIGSIAKIDCWTESTDLYMPIEIEYGKTGKYLASPNIDWWMLSVTVFSKLAPEFVDRVKKATVMQVIEGQHCGLYELINPPPGELKAKNEGSL